jgi:serine/threonine protein kinase
VTKAKSGVQGAAGTFAYMAPEIIAGGDYHEAADAYSFGIIMNEIVSRQVPYEGMNAAQISIAVLNKGIRPPIPANCPSQFSALIQSCWDQDPENRPPFSFIVEQLNKQLQEAKKKPADYRPV